MDTVKEEIAKAAAAAKSGNSESAIEMLKELVDRNPDHELAVGMLASLYADLGMMDRAERLFEQVLNINLANPLARLHLGTTRMQLGKHEQALSTLEPLLQSQDDFIAHFYCGMLQLELNNIQESRINLDIASQRMPVEHPLRPNLDAALDSIRDSASL